MKKFLVILLFCLVALVKVQAQSKDYKQRVESIYQNINQYFRDEQTGLYFEVYNSKLKQEEREISFLWPLCALIQSANEMEVLEPNKFYVDTVLKAIDQYYSTQLPSPGYQAVITTRKVDTRFYDDNEWIAIALLDAYQRKHDKKYLEISKDIFKFLMTGEDKLTGGGVYWAEGDLTTKNTCSNGPAILIALQLYNITHQKLYLKKALEIYEWTNKQLQAPSGNFYDAIKIPSLRIDSALYTYNSGTMLQANALLYQITKNNKYLKEAKRIAVAVETHFYRNNKFINGYWFNVVLLRGFIELQKIDHNNHYLALFSAHAEQIWLKDKDSNQLYGEKKNIKSLIDQAAMLETFARLSLVQKFINEDKKSNFEN